MSRKNECMPCLMRIPGLGTLIEISNDFVSEGSPEFFGKIAPARYWLSTLGWPVCLSIALAALASPIMDPIVRTEAKAFDAALTIIPSLLGFGVGAYALIFGLGGDILHNIQIAHIKNQETTSGKNTSVLHINSMFALPMLIMVITIIFAAIQKIIHDSNCLSFLVWFLTFFSLILCYQLIRSLYRLGRVIILERLPH